MSNRGGSFCHLSREEYMIKWQSPCPCNPWGHSQKCNNITLTITRCATTGPWRILIMSDDLLRGHGWVLLLQPTRGHRLNQYYCCNLPGRQTGNGLTQKLLFLFLSLCYSNTSGKPYCFSLFLLICTSTTNEKSSLAIKSVIDALSLMLIKTKNAHLALKTDWTNCFAAVFFCPIFTFTFVPPTHPYPLREKHFQEMGKCTVMVMSVSLILSWNLHFNSQQCLCLPFLPSFQFHLDSMKDHVWSYSCNIWI